MKFRPLHDRVVVKRIDRHRVNLGGTVIVTATGCEELNHIPTTVTHKQ